jgi:pimeloyl-ACP methyl ester carboxylesterase
MKLVTAAVFAAAITAASASPASAISLVALDPFLVDTDHLGDIGLSEFLAGNPTIANYAALNLSADGASAAIAVVETDSPSSVVLTISGPATLLPYSNTFLKQAPAAGTQSLTVSGASLLHINGHYYAPALVQGPLTGYASPTAISLTATQGPATAIDSLNLVIPPVVLVHGLWGDKTSLAFVRAYLDANQPWIGQADLVAPICYSLYLAFDAKKDPLTNGKDPCEVTSHAALQSEIDGLLAELDSEHTVGARVDIIAHSMGGLVARNYASQPTYGSARNRGLGQFHTIVTLDTPEIGSLLANFLVAHRLDTQKAPITTFPGLVWSALCGGADVETCFDENGDPLSAPTLPIDTGAVYSLEPGSPSLTNPMLSGPNIANATWRAISATAPKNSALAFGLDTLIAAIYPNPSAPSVPTVNSILKNLPNDAIVTIASQTQGAQADQFYTFPNLSHTSLPAAILSYLSGYNDNSVVDDPSHGTYKLAACWLETTGADSCKPAQATTVASESANGLTLVDRIRIHAPETAELGGKTEIALKITAPGSVQQLTVYQLGEMGRTLLEPVTVSRQKVGVFYIDVTPLLLGPVTLGVRAQFSDGSVSIRQASIYVKPPKSPPLSFQANDLPVMVLTLNADTQVSMPHPIAVYPPPVGRIELNSRFVTYRLVAQSGKSVVSVTRNGLMHALAPGEATVEARFGSSIANLRVIVRASQQ